MELRLIRTFFSDKQTIGELYIDDKLTYYTMEDKDRYLENNGCSSKIPKETAIPRGKYKVIVDYSNRFKKDMPHVLDVPCFEGIRIHVGNYAGDTEGCLLIGLGYSLTDKEWMVIQSQKAFDDFFPKLKKALEKDEVWIEVF